MSSAVGIDDAAAARDHPIEPAVIERLEEDEDGSRPRHLLCVDQLFAAAELAGGDEVLDPRDYHGDDGPRLRYAGGLGRHPDLHDLGLGLPEPGLKASPAGTLRD